MGQERPSTEAKQANQAAKQRKRGIVVVKLPILLSYSERQRDLYLFVIYDSELNTVTETGPIDTRYLAQAEARESECADRSVTHPVTVEYCVCVCVLPRTQGIVRRSGPDSGEVARPRRVDPVSGVRCGVPFFYG